MSVANGYKRRPRKGALVFAGCWLHKVAPCACLPDGPWEVTSVEPDGMVNAELVDNRRRSMSAHFTHCRKA